MQHNVVEARTDHKLRVEHLKHKLFDMDDASIQSWLDKEVTDVRDVRKVLALFARTIRQLVRDGG